MNALLARTALLACALAASGAAGCSPSFDHLEMDPVTSPPRPVTLGSTQIEVPEGIAVAFNAIPMAGGNKLDKTVQLTSTDSSVLGVAPDASSSQDGSTQSFVLFGVAQGMAGVNVILDGEQQETIPAVVGAPTP